MLRNKNKYLVLILLIILFVNEFIFPGNKIFPGIGILSDSLNSLFSEYELLFHFSVTSALIYLLMIVVSGFVVLFNRILPDGFSTGLTKFNLSNSYFVFFSGFLIVAAVTNHSYNWWILYTLLSFIVLNVFYIENRKTDDNLQQPLDAVKNLLTKQQINKNVLLKFVKTEQIRFLYKVHSFLWIYFIISEYINQEKGMGYLLNRLISYNDFSGVWCLVLFNILALYTGDFILQIIIRKLGFENK